jgi:hypothetical protein
MSELLELQNASGIEGWCPEYWSPVRLHKRKRKRNKNRKKEKEKERERERKGEKNTAPKQAKEKFSNPDNIVLFCLSLFFSLALLFCAAASMEVDGKLVQRHAGRF